MENIKDINALKFIFVLFMGAAIIVAPGCQGDRIETEQPEIQNLSGEDYYPIWSPDGKTISFISDRYGSEDIFIIDPDGSNERRLTDSPAHDRRASWSPDGRKIAFVSERDGNAEVYVVDSDGQNQKRLTDNPSYDSNPC